MPSTSVRRYRETIRDFGNDVKPALAINSRDSILKRNSVEKENSIFTQFAFLPFRTRAIKRRKNSTSNNRKRETIHHFGVKVNLESSSEIKKVVSCVVNVTGRVEWRADMSGGDSQEEEIRICFTWKGSIWMRSLLESSLRPTPAEGRIKIRRGAKNSIGPDKRLGV